MDLKFAQINMGRSNCGMNEMRSLMDKSDFSVVVIQDTLSQRSSSVARMQVILYVRCRQSLLGPNDFLDWNTHGNLNGAIQ